MNKFKKSLIEKTEKKIFSKYNLKPYYFFKTKQRKVIQCLNRKKEKCFVKIRINKNRQAQKDFLKEALFLKFLNTINKSFTSPQEVQYNLKNQPEYFFYSYIHGKDLANYLYPFFLDKKKAKNLDFKKIIDGLISLQKNTKIILKTLKELEEFDFLNFFKKYQKISKKYFGKKYFQQAKIILEKNKKFLKTSNFFLSHSDFLPNNVILTSTKEIAFIDWEHLSLNNRAFDLTFFWLASIFVPKFQKKFLKYFFEKFKEKEIQKLFYLDIIILIPKFLQIIDDMLKNNKENFSKKIITEKHFKKVLIFADKNIVWYKKVFLKAIKKNQ